jgi:predicted GIY-YIG superfamily endonuclease
MSAYVYRLYDSADRLLYVGCTDDVDRRLAQHRRKGTGGGADISRCHAVAYPTRVEALGAESLAICAESPLLNVRQKSSPATRYPSRRVIASQVRAAMLGAGINQTALAHRIAMSRGSLSERLACRSSFNTDHLFLIAEALGTDPISLMIPARPESAA